MALTAKAREVFDKGTKVRGKSSDLYRRDAHGNLLYLHSYGKKSQMGWEMDHRKPKAKGGSDSIRNLQPLQWLDNRSKGCKHPYYK